MNSCIGKAGLITPVPGGVALLTTAMLMYNTVKAFINQERLNGSCYLMEEVSLHPVSFVYCKWITIQNVYQKNDILNRKNGMNAILDKFV